MAEPNEQDALLELERRAMAGDPSITKEIADKVKTKLEGYRQQGIIKPLQSEEGKPVPEWAAKPYGEQINVYSGIRRGLDTFKPEYAGNALTGGLENTIQGIYSGFGSEGQRDWWAQFGSTDNVIRNNLFGAALTESEKAAYASTTINPSMDPKEVVRNLESRKSILDEALKRRTQFLKAQGYSKEAIEALAGQYAQELGAVAGLENAPPGSANSKSADDVVNGTPVVSQTGAGEVVTPEDREFKKQADELLANGGSRADFDALAQRFGRQPFDATLDAAIKARTEGAPSVGFRINPSGKKEASALGAVAASPVGSFMVGAGDAVTAGFQDEIAGVLGGDTGQARLALDLSRRENPISSFAGSLAGGSLIPIGRGAQTARELAALGGGLGAAYGIGSGTTAEGRALGGVTGGVAGAALGAGTGRLGEIWRNRKGSLPTPPSGGAPLDAQQIAQASRDLNVPMMPGDVGGTPFSLASSFMRMTPGGAQPITAAARRSQDAAGEALSRIAATEGTAMEREAAGEAVRRGALEYRSGSRNSIGRIYDRAAEEAGDARIDPKQALEALDRNISELSDVPGGADGLNVLQGLRDEIAQRGTITVGGIRGMRTQLRQKFMKDGLRGSDVERRVNEVIAAASGDLIQSLEAQGKTQAAKSYAEADAQWAERIKTLDDVIMPIIGKRGEKSGEQITDALNAAAKGNNARLTKLFDALPPEEAGTARATMIEGLGKANAGGQNAAGDTFSFNTFLTNWNKIGNSAKNAMFSGENRKAIDQLAALAEKSKNASRWQNYSNTGIGILGVATGTVGGISGAVPIMAGQYLTGRLLASPAVARGILKIAQAKTPAAIQSRIENLSSIAAKDAALAPEITGLQQRLLSAMNDNIPSRAAASQDEQKQR